MDDHYGVLGVAEDATADEIRAAWRRLVFEHHPDRNPGDRTAAHRATVAINLAYEILINDDARRRYDDLRECSSQGEGQARGDAEKRSYEEAKKKYDEAEEQARERLRKWFYDRLGVRSEKPHRCYTIEGNGSAIDDLISRIDRRLDGRVWEYRVKSAPDSAYRMAYRIRVVFDPEHCGFRECHADWVENYYYGLFKPGTQEDAVYNEALVTNWIGDILEEETCSHRVSVFFGIVGSIPAPWRCYVDLYVVQNITALDAFFHASVPGLSKFAKEHRYEVASVFDEVAADLGVTPAALCTDPRLRRDIARKAENLLRGGRGMKTLREWSS